MDSLTGQGNGQVDFLAAFQLCVPLTHFLFQNLNVHSFPLWISHMLDLVNLIFLHCFLKDSLYNFMWGCCWTNHKILRTFCIDDLGQYMDCFLLKTVVRKGWRWWKLHVTEDGRFCSFWGIPEYPALFIGFITSHCNFYVTQSGLCGPAASACYLGLFRNAASGPTLDLLNQNRHINKIHRWFMPTVQFEKLFFFFLSQMSFSFLHFQHCIQSLVDNWNLMNIY